MLFEVFCYECYKLLVGNLAVLISVRLRYNAIEVGLVEKWEQVVVRFEYARQLFLCNGAGAVAIEKLKRFPQVSILEV